MSFLHGARLRHRPLENVLEHIEHLVRAGFKDIRFITLDSLAYLSDDGVHPDLELCWLHGTSVRESVVCTSTISFSSHFDFGNTWN